MVSMTDVRSAQMKAKTDCFCIVESVVAYGCNTVLAEITRDAVKELSATGSDPDDTY